jgi:tetratricopeptide (TPR) repeat protein
MEHDDRDRGGPHLGEPGQLFSEEAIALHAQFAQHGDFDVLAKAVGLYCAALATGPLEPASRARLLNNLTAALKVVFEHQEAIGAHPQGHPDYLFSLNKLADTIHTRFRHFGDLNFLAEVITLRRLALNLRPSGNSERSSSLDSLATALITRLEHTGDPDSLTEAIDLHRQALDLRPLGHPDRFCSLNNLAIALHTRFRQVGDIDLLTEEIDLFRQSLDLLPTGHPTRPALLNNIANVLKTRFQHLGDDKSLEEAIETHREVLKLRPPGHPARSNTLNNLANALKNQFQHLGDFGLLTEAIGLHREALDLRPPGHSDHSVSLDNLGSTLCLRFNQLGDVDSIREGTELHRQALRLRPPGHPARAISLSNLADALTTRYEQLRDVDSLTEAVELLREAQDIYPLGHPNRPSSLSKLAAVLCYRFEQHRDMNLLEEAIELRRCALALCPQSHIARPAALASLGRALSARFEERHDVRDLDEEMSLAREGLQSCVRGHPMRQHFLFALGTCMLQTDTYVFDFENGIHHILEALRDITSPARQSLSEAVHVLHTVQAAFLCMTDRASISELSGSGYDRMVLHVYALVIRLMPRVASFGLDRLQRLRELSQAYTVSRDAAAHAIRTGHTTEAVEMLEEGRSVFWAQVLRLRTDLDLLPTQDADELRRLFRTLESGSRCDDSLNTVLRDRHIEEHRRMGDVAEALVAEIRSRPGMSRFMQPPTFSTLVQGLPEAGFVVLLVASELGYHALVINRAAGASTQPKSITLAPPQGGFFSEAVRETMPRDGGSGDHLSRNPYTSRAFGVSKKNNQSREPIDATLEQLWISIVKPIIDVLGLEVCYCDSWRA